MKRIIIILGLLLPVLLPARQKLVSPLNPSTAVLVSEKDNLMSHCPSTVITEDGQVYVAYYYDKVQAVEDGKTTSIVLTLDNFSIKRLRNPVFERQVIMKYGMAVGDYVQENLPPYDPTLVQQGDKIYVIFQGCQKEDKGKRYYMRTYDRRSGTFDDKLPSCNLTIDGKNFPISAEGIKEIYRNLGLGDADNVESSVLNHTFFKDGEWYYNSIGCWCSPQARPIIVRTRNFIDYETVFVCREFEKGAAESSIAILDGEFYIICRSARPKDGRGTYLAKYSSDGTCLVQPYRIGDIESRPQLIVRNGKVVAFYNAGPELITENGRIRRSRLRVSVLNEFASPVRSWDITNDSSIQYYNLTEYKGDLYITFTEDRYFRKLSQLKGNISFCKTEF